MVMKKPVYVKQSQKYMTVRTTSVHKIPGTFALQIGGKKEEVVRRGVICVAKHVEYEIKCGDLRKKIGEICRHSLRGLCGLKFSGSFSPSNSGSSQPTRAVWIEMTSLG